MGVVDSLGVVGMFWEAVESNAAVRDPPDPWKIFHTEGCFRIAKTLAVITGGHGYQIE